MTQIFLMPDQKAALVKAYTLFRTRPRHSLQDLANEINSSKLLGFTDTAAKLQEEYNQVVTGYAFLTDTAANAEKLGYKDVADLLVKMSSGLVGGERKMKSIPADIVERISDTVYDLINQQTFFDLLK